MANLPRSSSPGPLDKALIEFGKTTVLNSLNVLKDFISFMVPLTTGLITAYIALLQFMGIVDVSQITTTVRSNFVWPPVLMFLSLVSFVFASFPIPRLLAMGNPASIKKYRLDTFRWKYIGSAIGSFFFVTGVITMIFLIVPLSQVNEDDEVAEQNVVFQNPRFQYEVTYPSYWNLKNMNSSRDIILNFHDDSQIPFIRIIGSDFSTPQQLHIYASMRGHALKANSTTPVTLDGNAAYLIQWNNATSFGTEVVSIVNNRGFLVDYTADKFDYPIYLPMVQKITQSIRFD